MGWGMPGLGVSHPGAQRFFSRGSSPFFNHVVPAMLLPKRENPRNSGGKSERMLAAGVDFELVCRPVRIDGVCIFLRPLRN